MTATRRALREAVRHHRRGELAQAQAAYQQILSQEPQHPAALHGMGLLALQAGRADVAIGLIGQAARLVPDHSGYHLDLGLALRERGHLEEARAAFRVASLLDAKDATPIAAMADMLVRLHRLDEAEVAYRDALRLTPRRAELHHGLGLVLRGLHRLREAVEALREAAVLTPRDAAIRNDLGGALLDLGQPEAAEIELRAVLAEHPGHARALGNLASALQDLRRPSEALAAAEAALAGAPDDPDIRNNLGIALRELDRGDDALACFDAVLAADPRHAPAHLNAASILLTRGDFGRGWREFEWRDRVPGAAPPAYGPVWQGEPLAGRTLLVHAEQGFGDTIQFCRFVSHIGGGRVRLSVPPALARLLAPLTDRDAGDADLHCPLLSLPHLLGVALDRLAETGPYLRADPHAVSGWRTRLDDLGGKRVGVCWAGSDAYAQDRRRSLAPSLFSALASAPGVSLVSLQKGHRAPDFIADWTEELGDFADTAALIEALDVVVSVDTAVAHLAGALGKRVLLMDRFAGDWRWMRGRRDSPWYPTMRIYRQPAPGDWDHVLAEVIAALS